MLSRRLVSLLHRTSRMVWRNRWILLSLVLTLTAIAEIAWSVPPWLNIVLVALSVLLFVVELRDFLRHRKELDFPARVDNRLAAIGAALPDNGRFELWQLPAGSFVYDAAFTRAVQRGLVTATLRPSSFERPVEFADLAEAFVHRSDYLKFAHYDGHVAGLDTNLGRDPGVGRLDVAIVPGRYSDHVATNLFAARDVRVGRWHRTELGRRLFVDRAQRLRELGDSWLLNALGASVIAVTNDRKIIAIGQSSANQSSRGLLAPTGSGSLEPKDFSGATTRDFGELIQTGALREMREEAGITEKDVDECRFLGFGRWIEKAALPEGICVAFLTIDSHEVLRRPIPKSESLYSVEKVVIDFDLRSEDLVTDSRVQGQLSLPLSVGLKLMAMARRDSESPLHRDMQSIA